jgi:hypothetical protein
MRNLLLIQSEISDWHLLALSQIASSDSGVGDLGPPAKMAVAAEHLHDGPETRSFLSR